MAKRITDPCPVCGRPWPERIITTPEGIIAVLQTGTQPRNVYAGRDGKYYITFRGGQVTREAVHEALDRGLIIPEWPDTPHEYWRLAG